MWLAYLDETGNTGRNLDSVDQPVHLIATVLLHEDKIQEAHTELRTLASTHFGTKARDADFEFHGAEIYGGSGPFKGLKPQERVDLYGEVLRALATCDARVIVRGVQKAGLKRRYPNPMHPHDICLMYSVESIEVFAKAREKKTGTACKVLLVADDNVEIRTAALRDVASYQEFGTSWGWRPTNVDHIVDTIHFVQSHTNWAMQLADCVAFVARRRLGVLSKPKAQRTKADGAVLDLWTTHVNPQLFENKVWYP